MKKIALLFIATATLTIVGCSNDDDTTSIQDVAVTLNFTENFDGTAITNADYETTNYNNANGESMTISKLVYLISDVEFTNAAGEVFTGGGYNLMDARAGTNKSFIPNVVIPEGQYNVSFTFGFDDEDNQDGVYADLNSSDGGWGVPAPLGGGYHYMRLEGTYNNDIGAATNFQYHTIRANDMSTTPLTLQDTSFKVDLGVITIVEGTNIEVGMNVAEWFKNPNTWDLNVLGQALMPNFDAQIMMNENGDGSVFDLEAVTVQ